MLLLERRLQKIVEQQQSTTSYQSSSASDTPQTTDYPRLTDEEKYILDAEIDSSKRKDYVLEATLSGRPKILESISFQSSVLDKYL